jgi:putative DNA primase/helicase
MNAPVEALPLYGLEALGDARQVIVVGDDKCRDALATETGRTVVSWAGGTQGVKHTDWSPLAGRNVVIWPDADKPADEIASILTGIECTVRVMAGADGAAIPSVASAIRDGWDKNRLDGLMRSTVRPWSQPQSPPAERPAAPIDRITPAAPVAAVRKDRLASEPIYIVKGDVHEAVDRAMAVLSDASLGIYARGDDLVRAVTYSLPARTLTVAKQGENVDRPDGAVIIATLPDVALVEALTRHARFAKWDGRADKFVPCDCPAEVARIILANKGHGWTVPRLRAVISAPTLRPDGTVLSAPGYDAATGLLLVGDRIWRQVPDSPSKRDALDALDALVEPIDAFPFVDNADRAAALALLITSVMRPCLRTVPMFAITAPAAGTGKSLLIDIAAILATGRKAAVVTPTQDEAELEKRIGAAALAGDQIISIDNVTHILRSDQLCQMLTQDEVQVRVLGASKNVRIPSTALICATGNNLSIHGDLNRRAIRIRLDAKCERPDERRFDRDPTSLALRKRAEIVAAALTIVRAYLSAGAPSQGSPMGSFEDWSDTVRSALIWLGMGDCRGDIDAMRSDDPEKTELAEIIDALPTGRFTVREVAHNVSESPEMREVFAGFIGRNGVFATKSFGRYLARFRGTIIGGRSIELAAKDIRGAVWQVQGQAGQEW